MPSRILTTIYRHLSSLAAAIACQAVLRLICMTCAARQVPAQVDSRCTLTLLCSRRYHDCEVDSGVPIFFCTAKMSWLRPETLTLYCMSRHSHLRGYTCEREIQVSAEAFSLRTCYAGSLEACSSFLLLRREGSGGAEGVSLFERAPLRPMTCGEARGQPPRQTACDIARTHTTPGPCIRKKLTFTFLTSI